MLGLGWKVFSDTALEDLSVACAKSLIRSADLYDLRSIFPNTIIAYLSL